MTYTMSALSIAMIWLMGNKWKYAPIIGLINQIFWVIYVIDRSEYGLMPMAVAYTIIHARNCYKWLKEKE